MGIPQQVTDQAKQVEEFYEKLKEANEPEAENEPSDPVAEQPQTEPEVKEDYEKRFKNYKASTDQTIHSLRQEIAKLQTQPQEPPKQEPEAIPLDMAALKEVYSDEEIDGFKTLVNSEVVGLKQQVEALTTRLNQQDQVREEDRQNQVTSNIIKAVRDAVPNYDDINENAKFLDWMKGYDDYGNHRMQMFNVAKQTNDVNRIISFYQEWSANNRQPQTVDNRQLQQVPDSNSSTTPDDNKIHWTEALIDKFYRDKRAGLIPPDEADALEQDMLATLSRG